MFTWSSARSPSEGGKVSQVGRIASTPEAIREFAAGLGSEDQVVLDASGSVMAIARILRESNVGRVVVSDAAQTRAISHARVKSDRFDAAMLARLLSSGMRSEAWVPDEATLALRPACRPPRDSDPRAHPDQEPGARCRDALSARPPAS